MALGRQGRVGYSLNTPLKSPLVQAEQVPQVLAAGHRGVGSQTVPVPTLKGLNPRSMLPHRWGSTPSGSGCLYRRLPRVAPDWAPPGAIRIGPLRGPK